MRRLILLLAVVTMLSGSAALAATTTKRIEACRTTDGFLRVPAAGKNCTKTERPLSWNVRGPRGPAGPSDLYFDDGGVRVDITGVAQSDGSGFTTINTVDLPPGSYLVETNVDLANEDAVSGAFLICGITGTGIPHPLYPHAKVQRSTFPTTTNDNVTLPISTVVSATTAISLHVLCARSWSNDAVVSAVAPVSAVKVREVRLS